MRVVLDTNVLLAGFGTRGLCEALLEAVLAGHDLCLCQAILAELANHLPSKFKTPPARANEILCFLRAQADIFEPAHVPADACRDPEDLMVLGTAVAAQADCIVTGDKDLLILGQYQNIPIRTPRAFYDSIK